MKTIAIIPAHNEQAHIAQVVRGVIKHVNTVIVVDDGSTDNTYQEASGANLVLKHIINLGKGVALKTGFEAALRFNPDIIITIDGDMQNDPDDIPRFIAAMKKTNADIIIGKRVVSRNAPLTAKVGNKLLTSVFRLLFNANVTDTQSGYRAFKPSIYRKIYWRGTGYTVETEMLANGRRHRLKFREIPIEASYLDQLKGTNIFDGIKIFLSMIMWRLKL